MDSEKHGIIMDFIFEYFSHWSDEDMQEAFCLVGNGEIIRGTYQPEIEELRQVLKFRGIFHLSLCRDSNYGNKLFKKGNAMQKQNDVSAFCQEHGLTEAQFFGQEKYDGNLDLSSLTTLPEGISLTVGGGLDLSSLTPKTRDKVHAQLLPVDMALTWQDGKYILVDGIFSEVVAQRGNVRKVRNIGKTDIHYLVTDGQGKWAHGDTLRAARNDFMYKIGGRDTSKYAGLTLDSVLTMGKAIEAYRVITGACETGTKMFMQGLRKPKKKYAIKEIIQITKGKYGSETFQTFFEGR